MNNSPLVTNNAHLFTLLIANKIIGITLGK
jgi:hypothetical protein